MLQDNVLKLETEISEKISLLETLSFSDQSYESTNASVTDMRKRLSDIREDLVTLEGKRNKLGESIEKCSAELEKFSSTPRKSNTVQVARAQSEQSEQSDIPQRTTAKPKGKKK